MKKTTLNLNYIFFVGVLLFFTSSAMAQENTPPSISITVPSDSAWFAEPANINIITDVNDEDGTVTRVEFYNGTTKIGEDTIFASETSNLPKHWHESGGFGTSTIGGLEGTVYKVTNLNNTGSGSFREAVSGNNRLVVFEVGGVIDLNNDDIDVGSNVTIAGQTAPSPGITLIRANISADGNNTVVSHITILLGDDTEGEKDVANIRGDNVVFDHVTASWSIDEVLSIHGVDNVTLYKCIVAEGLQYAGHADSEHSKGSLINHSPTNLSLIGCLYTHNAMRGPRCDGGEIFIANQVNYNWTTGWDEPEPHWFNWVVHVYGGVNVGFVGNVALQGPESVGEIYLDGHISTTNYAYMDDNIILDEEGNDLQIYDTNDIVPLNDPPLWPVGFEALPAHESLYENLRTVGSRPGDRDTHNSRIVRTVANGDGEVIDSQEEVGGYPAYSQTSHSLVVPDGVEARQAWLDSLEDKISVDTLIDLSRLYSMVGSRASDKLLSDTGFTFNWNNVEEGTYTITAVATDDSGDSTISDPITVVVENVAVTGISVTPSSAFVNVGATTRLGYTISPFNATEQGVSWSSSDTLVATVNASGQVTGVATGLATITATTNDGSYTASSSITVANPVTGVSILPGYVSLKVDSTVQLKAIVEPSDADTTVAWSSSNTALATVDSTGLVTGISAGWVNITVKTNDGGKTATITISVTKNTTTSVIDETIADATDMLVYPNPVTGQLKVVLGNEFTNDAAIQLFDNTGRMVVNQKSNGSENIIHMESLSPGLYLVKVSSGGKSAVQQIIKK
jgi:hypothetical protein